MAYGNGHRLLLSLSMYQHMSNFIDSDIENAEVRLGLNCNEMIYHVYQMLKASSSIVQHMVMFSVCSL
jgi:hypothetical protein